MPKLEDIDFKCIIGLDYPSYGRSYVNINKSLKV